ncbi:WhiB family transcriptional regulator [Cutibacterium equinum]|uniref:WhiB family transcriptional regulator n=1 Tax=Cutibacterium equinum TaxID=3016342 RepID=A0ABY7QXV6_9ACTN|nr:WhiB family transcriptional regulator [Cutibacterium equinum]WCC79870.1 WhiB family transcriptional regulator [Cutibacterium equinum]
MNRTSDRTLPACANLTAVFQHPLLEGDSAAATPDEHRLERALRTQAQAACSACPLFEQCLENAILNHDVAGFAAGTTPRQRSRIRSRLGVRVRPEDFESYAGVISPGRQVSTQDVVKLRQAHPDQPLSFIAERLGCSLSTVKRHMRQARDTSSAPRHNAPAKAKMTSLAAAYETVTGRPHPRRARLAA